MYYANDFDGVVSDSINDGVALARRHAELRPNFGMRAPETWILGKRVAALVQPA